MRIPCSQHAIFEYIRNEHIDPHVKDEMVNGWIKDGCIDIDKVLFPIQQVIKHTEEICKKK